VSTKQNCVPVVATRAGERRSKEGVIVGPLSQPTLTIWPVNTTKMGHFAGAMLSVALCNVS
jgi:hypothetical protein